MPINTFFDESTARMRVRMRMDGGVYPVLCRRRRDEQSPSARNIFQNESRVQKKGGVLQAHRRQHRNRALYNIFFFFITVSHRARLYRDPPLDK